MPSPNTPHVQQNTQVLPTHTQSSVNVLPLSHNNEHIHTMQARPHTMPTPSRESRVPWTKKETWPSTRQSWRKSLGLLLLETFLQKNLLCDVEVIQNHLVHPALRAFPLLIILHCLQQPTPMVQGKNRTPWYSSWVCKAAGQHHLRNLEMQSLGPKPRPTKSDTAF